MDSSNHLYLNNVSVHEVLKHTGDQHMFKQIETLDFIKHLFSNFIVMDNTEMEIIYERRRGGKVRTRYFGAWFPLYSALPETDYLRIMNCCCALVNQDPFKLKHEKIASTIWVEYSSNGKTHIFDYSFYSRLALGAPQITIRQQKRFNLYQKQRAEHRARYTLEK